MWAWGTGELVCSFGNTHTGLRMCPKMYLLYANHRGWLHNTIDLHGAGTEDRGKHQQRTKSTMRTYVWSRV